MQRWLVLGIFVLSGAAGLVYEIVWSRELVLVFGNTTQAVSAILTGFFGGMALGAVVGGRVADRVASPLRLYGWLELILVGVVLVTPFTFRLIDDAYRGVYPVLEGTPGLAIARLVLAVLALAPATILMGATFPSLTRHLSSSATLSRSFGRLYAANTIGAIVGTAVTGLVLIEILGLGGALAVGATCSLVAGLIAVALSRGPRASATSAAAAPRVVEPPRAVEPHRVSIAPTRLALVVAGISGLTSLGYQVTWTRLLASGTGNTTYVFTTILAVFLAGLAIGALVYNLIGPRLRDPVRFLALSQGAVAVLALIGLLTLVRPEDLAPNDAMATLGILFGSVITVVLPVTIVLGVAFPAASALLPDGASRAGSESGALLGVNTFGAILGSLVIPFALMPAIGSPAVIVLLAAVNAVTAIGLALVGGRRSVTAIALGAAAIATILVAVARPGTIRQPNEAFIERVGGELYASAEDEIASVQAGRIGATPQLWVAGTAMTLLTVDAKLMPVLPLIARPDAERALVVAFGMGSSYRTALIAGLRTDAVELVPSVPGMFGHYYADAEAVLADPGGRVIVADGRNHLELSGERFDIIVTDPPPPIESSGASVISSREYYEAGRAHLTPDGVMMQWVPYGGPEAEWKEHVRTFASVFPEVLVVRGPGGYGAYLLGAEAPITLDPAVARTILARPGVLEDISSAYDSPATTIEGWLAVIDRATMFDTAGARAYAGDGPLITDDRPRPEYFLLRRLFGD